MNADMPSTDDQKRRFAALFDDVAPVYDTLDVEFFTPFGRHLVDLASRATPPTAQTTVIVARMTTRAWPGRRSCTCRLYTVGAPEAGTSRIDGSLLRDR